MSSRKQHSRKNKSRSNKKQGRYSRQKLFIGGTCATCGHMSPLFKGGKTCTFKRRGGGNDASFNGTLSEKNYHKLNSYQSDPVMQQIAVRQQPNTKGGKKYTKKASKRGGGLSLGMFNGQFAGPSSYNPFYTIGDLGTSQLASNYISGNIGSKILPNPSVLSQPVDTKYSPYNIPLA
jgi:hypothetical protein